MPTPAFPVRSNRLNASTSRDALPAPAPGVELGGGGSDGISRFECSSVASVLWNGFMGAPVGLSCKVSSSRSLEASDSGISKGSLWLNVRSLVWVIGVGSLLGIELSSGEEGGGDCTLTFLTGLTPPLTGDGEFEKLVSSGGSEWASAECRTGTAVAESFRRKGFEDGCSPDIMYDREGRRSCTRTPKRLALELLHGHVRSSPRHSRRRAGLRR